MRQFIYRLEGRLDRFKIQSTDPLVCVFRCPICGDSQKNKSKTRGYLLEKSTGIFFYCHNCQASMLGIKFLQKIAPDLYGQYQAEILANKPVRNSKSIIISNPEIDYKIDLPYPTMNTLPDDNPFIRYLHNRLIPPHTYRNIHLTNNALKLINSVCPDKFPDWQDLKREWGIVMPVRVGENIVGLCIRLFSDQFPKYLTIKHPKYEPKLIYSVENIDRFKTVYIVEGAFDSMFLPNSIAMLSGLYTGELPYPDRIWILDNEPRNQHTVSNMRKLVQKGEKVLSWSRWPGNEKDINEMVKAKTVDYVINYINDPGNIITGMQGVLILNNWSRIGT